MKAIYTYITISLLLLFASCNDQEFISHTPADLQSDEYRFTVSIPTPMEASTRAIGDELTQDYVTSLPMKVLVFDENGFFFAFQEAKAETFSPDENGGGKGTYTVSLPNSNTRCFLHFVLGNVEWGQYTASDSETSIFSQLETSNDVYWQRVEVENILKDENGQITSLPETIKLVRSYAQISVTTSEETPVNFELLGFTIVNETTASTVAPYTGNESENAPNGAFASYELPSGGDVYEEFTRLNPEFGGNNAGEVNDATPNDEDFSLNSQYVYERNQDNAQRPAYVLLKGTFDGTICYYKLDIVTTDENWVTSYLNLYRNFHYTITINQVTNAGYPTIEQAMNAVASNNIGASVEVSEVNNIQDGIDQLYVSTIDTLVVSSKPFTIKCEFTTNVRDENLKEIENDRIVITPIGGINSEAIENWTMENGWDAETGTLTINPIGDNDSDLPDLIEEQVFYVGVRNSGLSRRIVVRVRKPFQLIADCDDYVESKINAGLTLVVRLPENMPTSVFPLTLNIEPTKKSLYPDVIANRIPVGSVGNYSFDYQTTVTYNDYRQNPIFFFHFKTNRMDSETSIKVDNVYFLDTSNDPNVDDDKDNVAEFKNLQSGQTKYDFGNVTLTDGSSTGTPDSPLIFEDYNTKGKKVTLTFSLPCRSEEHLNADHPIEIFADYFDFEGENQPTSSTGTFTVRGDGQCIFYTPNEDNLSGTQTIEFTINRDLASETIQLSSFDHSTVTIDYRTPSLVVNLDYRYDNRTNNVPNNTEISIYLDADGDGNADNDELVTTKDTNNQGQITMDSFANIEESDTLIFRCTLRIQTGTGLFGRPIYDNITFTVSTTVQELLKNPSLTMTQGY